MTVYTLRPGLSFCRVDDRFVFLDLPQDRYFCLGDSAGRAFAALLSDGQHPPCGGLKRLEQAGIVVAAEGARPPRACAPPARVRTSLLDAEAKTTSGAVVAALVERARCRMELRRQPLSRILERLRERKLNAPQVSGTCGHAARVAAAFRRAASLVSAREQCLACSIAVARQLLRHRVRPCIVLGVKLRPFQAHCWVQIGDVAVNDRVDALLPFTPIHVV